MKHHPLRLIPSGRYEAHCIGSFVNLPAAEFDRAANEAVVAGLVPHELHALRNPVRTFLADRALLEAIVDARQHHVSWAAIGSLLGTSGEAARQRYGDLVKR